VDFNLKDQVVVITGASRGIGRACTLAFAAEGARLALLARTPEPLFELTARLKAQGNMVYGQPTDLTQPQEVERFTKGALAEFGRIDILINNAGTTGNPLPFDQLADSDWHEVFELNLMGTVRMTRAVLPVMQDQGSGSIVFIASESGIQPDPFMPHYNASKAALLALSKSLAASYGPNIRVNTVSPATTRTESLAALIPAEQEAEFIKSFRPHLVLGRAADPAEIARVVAFVASGAASFVTGANFRVDGGSVASIF
jgi:NAD(P)-dependent dehydrogenase (short-subunit alcohol dehydrogenase family)